MTETASPTDAVVDAALALAARMPWQNVTLSDIAAEAGLGLAALRKLVASKAHILAQFSRRVDAMLLEALAGETLEGEAHDRLFDVIMRRLELLEPWRPALKSILAAGPDDPIAVAAGALNAMDGQRWLMEAAGIAMPRDAIAQGVRLAGLAFVQQRTMRVWVEDDDPGHARTMAVLDRALRDGATWLSRLDAPMALCGAIAKAVGSLARGRGRGGTPAATPQATGNTTESPT
jgi:AcrR family transcriptional regulator